MSACLRLGTVVGMLLLASGGRVFAGDRSSDTDWLEQSDYGVFMHFLPSDAESLGKVDEFDVDGLAEQLERVGADYFVLTLGQNSGYYNAPNAVYDEYTGYEPGERCAKRDLPLELYAALAERDIRLMLYLPCQVPNRDPHAQASFGLPQGPRDQPLSVEFARRWAEVIGEWSRRYGDKVAGWWFDGAYAHIGFNEEIGQIYAQTVKEGNPHAIVTFNPGVRLIRWTQAEDYTAGELNEPFGFVPEGRWVDGSQWHALTYLGARWSARDTRFPAQRWANWVRRVNAGGGTVSLDAGPNWDPQCGPIGCISEEQIAQLQVIQAELSGIAVEPYIDPQQFEVPWPKMSHYRQPWRGFLETRSSEDFLRGIGVNLHIPNENEELAVRLLAEAGFRTFRIEVGWGAMNWDETRLNNEEQIRRRFELCAKYGIRPTILINAHQGVPCPAKFFTRRLMQDASAGATTVRLDNVEGLVVGRSGLNGLTGYWAAEALITAIDEQTGEVALSKPLPEPLAAGEVPMATLKYAPLFPPGTPQFDETAAGWVRHTRHVCRLAEEAGIEEFDIELWNELTFGTHFLNINDYYAKDSPRVSTDQPDFLRPGGRCWELARRTVDAINDEFPQVRTIWGFSNTTFYHCPIEDLPPGTDGQSYHPYGTGTRVIDGTPSRSDQPPLEGFVPRYRLRMPEGWAATFVQTECLMRLLRPDKRLSQSPPETTRFYHYITEHGVLPPECGVNDAADAWRLKSLCATRSFCFWLNKGVDALHYFVAYGKEPAGFGLLPPDLPQLPADAAFDDVATPPLHAIRNLTREFAESVPLEEIRPIEIENVVAAGPQTKVFNGEGEHPPLWHREVLAVLPFQVTPQKHVLAVYVMTRDVTEPFAPKWFRLDLRGAAGERVRYYDPIEDRSVVIETERGDEGLVRVTVPVAAHPRLLILESNDE